MDFTRIFSPKYQCLLQIFHDFPFHDFWEDASAKLVIHSGTWWLGTQIVLLVEPCWATHPVKFIWEIDRNSQAKPGYIRWELSKDQATPMLHHWEIHAKLCWTFRLATFKQSDLFIQMWLHSWKEFVQKTSLTLICNTLRPNHQLQKLVQICSHCVQTV